MHHRLLRPEALNRSRVGPEAPRWPAGGNLKWALPGLVLAACAPDPCAEGMAYTADGVAFNSLTQAFRHAADLDQTVHLCPGAHELSDDAIGMPTDRGEGTPTLLGHPDQTSVLVPGGRAQEVGARDDQPMLIEGLGFADSQTVGAPDPTCTNDGCDDLDWSRVTPFDEEGEPDGAINARRNVTFKNVTFTHNRGYWGGAVSVWRDQDATITFAGCTFSDNEAIDGTSGGGVLVYYDPLENGGKHTSNRVTIVSEDTDWGTGDDDNGPDDLAFASSNGDQYNPNVTVDASYRFDGVASFTCSGETQTCE